MCVSPGVASSFRGALHVGMVWWMCSMSGSAFIGVTSLSRWIFSISLSSLIARDLLTDAIFVRMCCRCVVVVGLSRVYR